MPQEPTQQQLEQLRDAIFRRRKVEAIKLYRHFSGSDLKDSKDYIDALSSEMELKHPEKFAPKPKGCTAVSAILFFVIFGFFLFFLLKLKGAESDSANPPNVSLPTLQQVLDSKQDLWGLAAMNQTNGASYEFFEKL